MFSKESLKSTKNYQGIKDLKSSLLERREAERYARHFNAAFPPEAYADKKVVGEKLKRGSVRLKRGKNWSSDLSRRRGLGKNPAFS